MLASHLPLHGFPRRHIGLYEVLAFPWIGSLEWIRRNLLIVDELERFRRDAGASRLRVLDFGGGKGLLAEALRLWGVTRHYEVVLADIDRTAIEATDLRAPIAAKVITDTTPPLPIDVGDIDVAVSTEVFEHIPRDLRDAWARELRRIARLGQVHTMPCDSADGRFAGTVADEAFQEWHVNTFGRPDGWTAEHLANGLPSINDIRELFGPAQIRGLANTSVWLESVQVHYSEGVVGRLMFLSDYLRVGRSLDSEPPFKACLVVVHARL